MLAMTATAFGTKPPAVVFEGTDCTCRNAFLTGSQCDQDILECEDGNNGGCLGNQLCKELYGSQPQCDTCTPQIGCKADGNACLPDATSPINSLQCTTCDENYEKNPTTGRCTKCGDDEYSNGIDACAPCTSQIGCKTNGNACLPDATSHINSLQCTTCDENYEKNPTTGRCTKCGDDEYSNGLDACVSCTAQIGCKTNANSCLPDATSPINSLGCTRCEENYEKNPTTGRCTKCPDGEHSNGLSPCAPCPPDQHNEATGCKDCREFFDVNSNSTLTLKDVPLPPDCYEMNFSGYGIKSIQPNLFESSPLSMLDLSNNPITQLAPGEFDTLLNQSELVYTKLNYRAGYSFKNFQFELILENVTACSMFSFTMDENKIISSKTGQAYDYREECTDMDLSKSSINGIESGSFDSLVSLQLLDIRWNNITYVPPNLFEFTALEPEDILLDLQTKCTGGFAFNIDSSGLVTNKEGLNYDYIIC
eukprot:Pgem_evm1s15885